MWTEESTLCKFCQYFDYILFVHSLLKLTVNRLILPKWYPVFHRVVFWLQFFFLIFINDLPANIHVNIRLFADDCIIYNVINTHEDNLALDCALQTVTKWCSDWQITLNAKKSTLFITSRKKNKSLFLYKINNTEWSAITEHKYLGLTITEDLRWSSRINHITATAFRRLFFIRCCLRLAPTDTKLLAYNAFVRPILEYTNIIWFPFTKEDIAKLEGIQRKAIRLIFNKYGPHESRAELMETAGIDSSAPSQNS